MASTTSPATPGLRIPRRAAAAALVLAAAAWAVSARRMAGMDAGPGIELGTVGWFAATWLAMMGAMMLPAIAPVAAGPATRRVSAAGRGPRAHAGLAAALFLGGYLLVWTLAGVGAYLALRAGGALAGDLFAWRRGGHWLAAGVLAAAAAYQLTGVKRRWLARCRIPLADANGRPGPAARAGVRAGGRCLVSSWALMAALFALGAMSLVWMALVAVLIAAERLTPLAWPARIAVAPVLFALALGVAFAPAHVPGLTVPGSPAAQRAMMRMSGSHAHTMGRLSGSQAHAMGRMSGSHAHAMGRGPGPMRPPTSVPHRHLS